MPCMGSGHILVYLFDVLMQIYEAQGYTRRNAAQSILINNLYGLDIDDRAAQMAYFAVMMKARQYDRRILTRGIVPHVYAVQESNGINRAQLDYFGDSLNETEKNAARIQMEKLLDTLVDAREYGSILQVENCDWDLLYRFVDDASMSGQISMNTLHLDNTQMRLRALIEIGQCLAQKYDVVATNPPYMGSSGMSVKLSSYVKKKYPDSKADMYSIFIERCGHMTCKYGYQAMITQHSWMFLSAFEKLRTKVLHNDIINMIHLGSRAFEEIGGEVVQTTSFVLRQHHDLRYRGIYCRLTDETTQQGKEDLFISQDFQFVCQQTLFNKIPGHPIAYWLSPSLLAVFDYPPLSNVGETREGVTTANNDLFLRMWFEININDIEFSCTSQKDSELSEKKWYPHHKGGEYRKWYGNLNYVIYWYKGAKDIRNYKDKEGRIRSHNYNLEYNFREYATWSRISSENVGLRYSPPGYVFDSASAGLFLPSDLLKYGMGFICSKIAKPLLLVLNPTIKIQPGDVAHLPLRIDNNQKSTVTTLVADNIVLEKKDWDSFEEAWDFKIHPLVECSHGVFTKKDVWDWRKCAYLIENSYQLWEHQCNVRFNKIKANEEELNRIFLRIYDLKNEFTPEVEEKDITVRKADLSRDIRSLISYAVGCMFGRYSLDVEGLAYAGGDWDSSKYTTYIPDADNILPITDEEYFKDDIVGMFCAWVKKVYGPDTLEENLDFVAKALGNKGNSSREVIRNYFLKDFFKDHCKTYQKRPIYWLFDSGKQNGFKALVYLHRYNADTIGNLRVDYLHRMQRIYESEINRMQDMIDNSTNAREVAASTKRKDKLQKQLKECREYDEKIGHLALSRIELDLDDGVKVNYRKVQTARDGKFYEVLADSKNIMGKQREK